jgi:hypothetical protein
MSTHDDVLIYLEEMLAELAKLAEARGLKLIAEIRSGDKKTKH